MSAADRKYQEIIKDVLEHGVWDSDGEVRPVYADGSPSYTKSIFGGQVKFHPWELPVISIKKTPVQSSINEVVHAFFRLQTNEISDFEDLGVGYWKDWELTDGTIGNSYGYQLNNQMQTIYHKGLGEYKEVNQVDYILHELEYNPYSRRIMCSYWNFDEDNKKALKECAYTIQFNVRPNVDSGVWQLDLLLVQRSVDLLHGLPSNWAGYYALQCALANLFGYKVGTFTHQMGNIHLYDNQIELAEQLLEEDPYKFKQPSIYVNPNVTNFYDYTVDDIKYVNYEHGKSYKTEVAI